MGGEGVGGIRPLPQIGLKEKNFTGRKFAGFDSCFGKNRKIQFPLNLKINVIPNKIFSLNAL